METLGGFYHCDDCNEFFPSWEEFLGHIEETYIQDRINDLNYQIKEAKHHNLFMIVCGMIMGGLIVSLIYHLTN